MKFIYTDSGKQALEAYKAQQVEQLQERIASRKYVFGDEEVEVTAADVKEASDPRSSSPRSLVDHNSILLVTMLYTILGAVTALVGLFYQHLKSLFRDSPMQFALVTAGTIIAMASGFMNSYLRERNRELEKTMRIEKLEKESKRSQS
jgi:hypothetical protein